jgi:acyl-coenzyme A thioesterase 13
VQLSTKHHQSGKLLARQAHNRVYQTCREKKKKKGFKPYIHLPSPNITMATNAKQQEEEEEEEEQEGDQQLATHQHVLQVWDRIRTNSPIYTYLLEKVELYHAEPAGIIRARLHVSSQHVNSKNILHGTVSACVVDWAGGLAIAAAHDGQRARTTNTGVSTDMHISFIGAAKEGDLLEIEGRITKLGRNLAFTTVSIAKVNLEDPEGKRIPVAEGSHTKYVAQSR